MCARAKTTKRGSVRGRILLAVLAAAVVSWLLVVLTYWVCFRPLLAVGR